MADIIEYPLEGDDENAADEAEHPDEAASSDVTAETDEPSILGFPGNDDTSDFAESDADGETADDFDEPVDDLDEAYRQALEKIDEAEWEIGQALSELNEPVPETELEPAGPLDEAEVAGRSAEMVDGFLDEQPEDEHRLRPSQILEAALFVGGQPLTAKKLAGMLKGTFDAEFVAGTIEEINQRYLDERRPYEIRLGEGGYELKLRYQFENIRHRVFGLGPKEVKLSQEALEILSLVAYHQPVSAAEIEDTGKSKPTGTLRQLLRRELIALERKEKSRKNVKYITTDRFLQVFGLGDIDELPMLGDIDFK